MSQGEISPLWPKYFPSEPMAQFDSRNEIILVFLNYFRRHPHLVEGCREDSSLVSLCVEELQQAIDWNEFMFALRSRPAEVIGCMGLALTLCKADAGWRTVVKWPKLQNLTPFVPIGDVKSGTVGNLVAVRGQVVKISSTGSLLVSGKFWCPKCQQEMTVHFEDGVYAQPSACATEKCRGRYLELLRNQVQCTDYQSIKLQELDERGDLSGSPRSIDVEVKGELINRCQVTDIVAIIGIVKTHQAYSSRLSHVDSAIFQIHIDANNVTNLSRAHRVVHVDDSAFRSFACSGRAPAVLISSLCPIICGKELVKLGLLLSLFGGSERSLDAHTDEGEEDNFEIHSNSHVLVLGDPGLGKSQLLRAVSACAPRSIMVAGHSTTTAGLTVSLTREGGRGDLGIEAGAILLADGGVCCIDELDKLECDSTALLEAMEQQSVSIAKCGVIASLKCRTSVIAAANPIGNCYNKSKTVLENVKMSQALLSRFDLIYILVDERDIVSDRIISEHIVRKRTGAMPDSASRHRKGVDVDNTEDTLTQKLSRAVAQISRSDLVDLSFIRGFVEYARRHVQPRLTPTAARVIQKLYLTMRAESRLGRSFPVTNRHLESMIRLSQARARMELREEVSEADATEVSMLLQESLLEAFAVEVGVIDLFGQTDSKRKRSGKLSTSKQVKVLISAMAAECCKGARANRLDRDHFSSAEIAELSHRLQLTADNNSLIEIMRNEGFLLLKGPRTYQLTTV